MSSRVIVLLGGLASSVFVFAAVATIQNTRRHGWYAWYRLATAGQVVDAQIIDTDPQNHRTCVFKYAVDSVSYTSSDQGCKSAVGDQVRVTYLPDDPSFATTA